jgi:hypothetical protein
MISLAIRVRRCSVSRFMALIIAPADNFYIMNDIKKTQPAVAKAAPDLKKKIRQTPTMSPFFSTGSQL